MEPESTFSSSKVCGNARSYKQMFNSMKKGKTTGESESEKYSPKKLKSEIVKLDWTDFKPRSSRKRKHYWLDRENKENKVSENSKNAEELNHVKDLTSTLSDRQGQEEIKRKGRLRDLEEKKRKRRLREQNLANQVLELEEGEIPPSPSTENSLVSTFDKSVLEEETNGEPKRQSLFDILNDLDEGIPTRSHYTNNSIRKVSEKGKISMNSQSGDVLNNFVDMEDREILAGPRDQRLIDKHKEGWDDRNCQREIPQKGIGISQLTSREMEEQLETDNEIVQLGKETQRAVTMADDHNCRKGIPQKSPENSQLRSRDTENEIVELGKETERPFTMSDGICLSDSEFKVDKVQPTDMTAICPGSPNVPAHVSDVFLNRKELSTSHVETIIVVDSDTDSDVVELTDQKSITSTSDAKNNEVNSSFNGLEDGATRSTSVGKQSPAQNDQIFDSVARSSENPQSTLDEVAMVDQAAECSSEIIPARNMQNTEAKSYSCDVEDGATRSASVGKQSPAQNDQIFDSVARSSEGPQSTLGEVAMVNQAAECSGETIPAHNMQNTEVKSYSHGVEDGATRATSMEKQSPAQNDQIFDSVARSSEDPQSTLDEVAIVDQAAECSGAIPARNMQNTEVKSYSLDVEDGSSRSTSVERQSIHKNKDIVDSIVKSSENLENSSDKVVTVDQPAVCSSHALPIQEQATPVEVANLPESPDRGEVPPVCMESHQQFTGTSTSVVPPDVSAVESMPMTSNQPPVSSVSPSSQSGPLQCPENDINFHEPGSRTNGQDSRSMATSLASIDVNLLLPGRTQFPCYDPLKNEMERLRRQHEQDIKMHEAKILHLKFERDEIIQKYEISFQEAEVELQQKTLDFKTKLVQVYLHRVLANAYIHQPDDLPEASTPDARQASSDAINLVRNPTQMSTVRLDQQQPVTVPFSPVVMQTSPRINQPSPMSNQPSPMSNQPPSSVPAARTFSAHMDSAIGFPQNGYPIRGVPPHLRASLRPPSNFPVSYSGELIQASPMSSDNH